MTEVDFLLCCENVYKVRPLQYDFLSKASVHMNLRFSYCSSSYIVDKKTLQTQPSNKSCLEKKEGGAWLVTWVAFVRFTVKTLKVSFYFPFFFLLLGGLNDVNASFEDTLLFTTMASSKSLIGFLDQASSVDATVKDIYVPEMTGLSSSAPLIRIFTPLSVVTHSPDTFSSERILCVGG